MSTEVAMTAGARLGWDNATLVAREDLTEDSAVFRIKAIQFDHFKAVHLNKQISL